MPLSLYSVRYWNRAIRSRSDFSFAGMDIGSLIFICWRDEGADRATHRI